MVQHELNVIRRTRLYEYIKRIVLYIFRHVPKTRPHFTDDQKFLYKQMQANYCRPHTAHASTARMHHCGVKNVVHPDFNDR